MLGEARLQALVCRRRAPGTRRRRRLRASPRRRRGRRARGRPGAGAAAAIQRRARQRAAHRAGAGGELGTSRPSSRTQRTAAHQAEPHAAGGGGASSSGAPCDDERGRRRRGGCGDGGREQRRPAGRAQVTYRVYNASDYPNIAMTPSSMVANGTLASGFSSVDWLCLADGCYEIVVDGGAADSEIGFEFVDEVGGHFQDFSAPYADHMCVSRGDVFEPDRDPTTPAPASFHVNVPPTARPLACRLEPTTPPTPPIPTPLSDGAPTIDRRRRPLRRRRPTTAPPTTAPPTRETDAGALPGADRRRVHERRARHRARRDRRRLRRRVLRGLRRRRGVRGRGRLRLGVVRRRRRARPRRRRRRRRRRSDALPDDAADARADDPSPTPLPTPAPTRTPVVQVSLGLSGIDCDDFDQTVYDEACDAVLSNATFEDATCALYTDGTGVTHERGARAARVHREHVRGQRGDHSVHSHVMATLEAAVSDGSFTTAIQTAAARRRLAGAGALGLRAARRLSMASAQADSVEVASSPATPPPSLSWRCASSSISASSSSAARTPHGSNQIECRPFFTIRQVSCTAAHTRIHSHLRPMPSGREQTCCRRRRRARLRARPPRRPRPRTDRGRRPDAARRLSARARAPTFPRAGAERHAGRF